MRPVLAAVLVLVALIDIGSHALHSSGGSDAAWCIPYHYTNPGIDCPHKRDHRTPDKGAFDDLGHAAVLLVREEPQVAGIVYRTELPVGAPNEFISRTLAPPFHPPKQA